MLSNELKNEFCKHISLIFGWGISSCRFVLYYLGLDVGVCIPSTAGGLAAHRLEFYFWTEEKQLGAGKILLYKHVEKGAVTQRWPPADFSQWFLIVFMYLSLYILSVLGRCFYFFFHCTKSHPTRRSPADLIQSTWKIKWLVSLYTSISDWVPG